MAAFVWDIFYNTVGTQIGVNSTSGVSAKRGDAAIQLILTNAGTPVLSPGGAPVGVCMRDPANLKGGYLAGPQILAAGTNATAGYTGTLSTDTDPVRTAVHANSSDPLPEDELYPAEISFYYTPTPAGSKPIESPSVPWNVIAPDYRPGTPPAPLAEQYPPAESVDTVAARNAAIAAAVAALPAPVNTSAAPIQPFAVWLTDGWRLTTVPSATAMVSLSGKAITSISGSGLAALAAGLSWYAYAWGALPTVDLSDNSLDLASVVGVIGVCAAASTQAYPGASTVPITVLLQGGTNTPPTYDIPATVTVGFPDRDNADRSAGANVGTWLTSTGFQVTVNFVPSVPLAASFTGSTEASASYNVGCSDDPTAAQMVTKLDQLSAGSANPSVQGVFTYADSTQWPLTQQTDDFNGGYCGVRNASNSHIAVIQQQGGTVNTN